MFHLKSYQLGVATVVVAECVSAYLLWRFTRPRTW